MILKRITNISHPMYCEALKLYQISFPYHKENEGHHLVIMTCPKQVSKDMFDTFSDYLKNRVMKNVFNKLEDTIC